VSETFLAGFALLQETEPGFLETALDFAKQQAIGFAKENPYLVFLMVWGAMRAMGTTVRSGTTGLFFSFGRATRVIDPGFVFKIPYFQTVRVLPTRSRTMDVPNQRVTSRDGLVWFVDVNLVYQVVDVRKALIQIDDLEKGMLQLLGLFVQDIVRQSGREEMRLSGGLDEELERAMAARLADWGVEVHHAGFTSIKPSPKTLRFTQQQHSTEERARALEHFESSGIPRGHALAMLGSAPRLQRRALRAQQRETRSRRRRRILRGVRRAERESRGELTAQQRGRVRQAVVARLEEGER